MAAIQSELTVIVKAKDLCSYVMTATEKSPKRFRFMLVAKLQSYALNTIENLCRANEVYVKPGNAVRLYMNFAEPVESYGTAWNDGGETKTQSSYIAVTRHDVSFSVSTESHPRGI